MKLALALVLAAGVVLGLAWPVGADDCDQFPYEPHCPTEGWAGYSDGRMAGDPNEDYSIWCKDGNLGIWRRGEDGRGERLHNVSLDAVALLHQQGDGLAVGADGDQVAVTRWGRQVEVSGWDNGNRRFGRNSKIFAAAECEGAGEGFRTAADKARHLRVSEEQALPEPP